MLNWRQSLYFSLMSLRGEPLGRHLTSWLQQERLGIPAKTTDERLASLLAHCRSQVPYYAAIMADLPGTFDQDPQAYLRQFPVLTRSTLKSRFNELKSADLAKRHWHVSATGGSTGEPARFIQDYGFAARSGAISLLYSQMIGHEPCDPQVYLWGSATDIVHSKENWRARFVGKLRQSIYLNAFQMSAENMRDYVAILNDVRPPLIIAYVDAIYELARLAEREALPVSPQTAIITSAGTLYPFMREKIEHVFHCFVFDRYGSREMGDIACERPDCQGLWVAPWGNYVEVVDSQGDPVPDGTEGRILVTSLSNYAMPLVRYEIGDRGIITHRNRPTESQGTFLQQLDGRASDCFMTRNGSIVPPQFFVHILGVVLNTGWIRKFQVIQEAYDQILVLIALAKGDDAPGEIPARASQQITMAIQRVMGQGCQVRYAVVADIPLGPSGKYRYTISQILS